MLDFSARDVLGDITPGETTVVEGSISNCETSEACLDSISDRLFDRRGCSSTGKGILRDTALTPILQAKQPFSIPDEICLDNVVHKIMETDHNGVPALPFTLDPSNPRNEPDDISTESDEELEDYKKNDFDVMSNSIHVFKGNDAISSSSNDYDADVLALTENNADGGESLTQNLLDNVGLGKPCSCSFCLKAAHMWMDLTFQDTRGRLTELRKSKKRASDQIARITQDFSKISKYAKLEIDLMQHWKMLFLHTQDALAHEIAQTQSDFDARSKLMENCKRDLELKSSSVLPVPDK